MAAGEYVSVSSQTDIEKADIEREKLELEQMPETELTILAQIYEKRGLKKETALMVAKVSLSCVITAQDLSVLPSSIKIISYEKLFSPITLSTQATNSGSDSSSLYSGTTIEIANIILFIRNVTAQLDNE